MRPPQAHPDARVLAIINHALNNADYYPDTQVALVRAFSSVFCTTDWWREMIDHNPGIADIVNIATRRLLH